MKIQIVTFVGHFCIRWLIAGAVKDVLNGVIPRMNIRGEVLVFMERRPGHEAGAQ